MIDVLSKWYLFLIVFYGSGSMFSLILTITLEILDKHFNLRYYKSYYKFNKLLSAVLLFFIVGFLAMGLITIGGVFIHTLIMLF